MNQGVRESLVYGLEPGLSPSWSTGTSFASPAGYETDYWDFQTQTVSGKYDNGVGSATLDNTGGLLAEAVAGLPDYTAWEVDTVTDTCLASNATAGDSDSEDLSIRVFLTQSTLATGGAKSIIGKLVSGAGPGWLLYFVAGTINLYLDDGTNAPKNLSVSIDLSDGDIHVISGWYDYSANMMYLKSDAFAQASLSTAGMTGSLSTTQPLRVGKSHVDTVIGVQMLFAGTCAGEDAQAHFNETVTIPEAV